MINRHWVTPYEGMRANAVTYLREGQIDAPMVVKGLK